MKNTNNKKFEVIIMADLLFNHSIYYRLAKNILIQIVLYYINNEKSFLLISFFPLKFYDI